MIHKAAAEFHRSSCMNAENANGTKQYRQMALPHFSHWCMNYSSVWCVAANSQQSSSDSLKLSNCFCHTAFVISKTSHWPLLVRKKTANIGNHMTAHDHAPSPMHHILGALWQPRWVDGTWLNPCYKSSHITALLEQSYQILKQSCVMQILIYLSSLFHSRALFNWKR